MRFTREFVEDIADSAHDLGFANRWPGIGESVQALREKLTRQIDEHMQPWAVVLDESVQFFFAFERFQYSRQLAADTSPFALQISRLRSVSLAIRELVYLGQEAPASALARIFVEDLELAMALADDPDFALAYAETDEPNNFWKKHLAYGKLSIRVRRFLERAGHSESIISSFLDEHKWNKDTYSSHVHSANHSSFRAGVSPSLVNPGMFLLGALGALSAHLPYLCLFVSRGTYLFSASCINIFTGSDPPPALAEYVQNEELSVALGSAQILQQLLVEHGPELQARCDAYFETVDAP